MHSHPFPSPTFGDLNTAERAILHAMRLWFRSRPNTTGALSAMRESLDAVGGGGVVVALFALLGAFAMARRSPNLRAAGCEEVDGDEIMLLDMLAAFQERRDYEAAKAMAGWLPVLSLPLAVEAGSDMAAALTRAGLRLRRLAGPGPVASARTTPLAIAGAGKPVPDHRRA